MYVSFLRRPLYLATIDDDVVSGCQRWTDVRTTTKSQQRSLFDVAMSNYSAFRVNRATHRTTFPIATQIRLESSISNSASYV